MPATQTPANVAAMAATNDINAANFFVRQYLAKKTNGVIASPASGNVAATNTEYLAALGAANVAILDAMAAANPQM